MVEKEQPKTLAQDPNFLLAQARYEESLVKDVTNKFGEVKVGRNELCPCGSGLKFKRCCGISE